MRRDRPPAKRMPAVVSVRAVAFGNSGAPKIQQATLAFQDKIHHKIGGVGGHFAGASGGSFRI